MSETERIRKVVKWLIYRGYADRESELAKKLGYNASSFSQILTGRVPMTNSFINRLCELDDNINKEWLEAGSGVMLKETGLDEAEKIPLLADNDLLAYPDLDTDSNFYFVPDFVQLNAKILYRKRGNDMEPKIKNGDMLAAKYIENNNNIIFGNTYIVVTKEYITVRKIFPNENGYNLIAENQKDFPKIEISEEDVVKLFLVVGLIRLI